MNSQVHIIGGGIAGVVSALAFARLKKYHLHLWEQAEVNFFYSSSRNAAMARTYEADPAISVLAKLGIEKLLWIEKQIGELIRKTGLILNPVEYDYCEEDFLRANPDSGHLLSTKKDFLLPDGRIFSGLNCPVGGIIDIHRLQQYLLRRCKAEGISIHTSSQITDIHTAKDAVTGFKVMQKREKSAVSLTPDDILVNAAGGWAPQILKKNNLWAPPVNAYKRHLYFISYPGGENFPILWDEMKDFYIRPESGGFLASHCDQTQTVAGDYDADPGEDVKFIRALAATFPFLAEARMRKVWSCIRSFSMDNRPVTGFDPLLKNLFWSCGWGGRGMCISLAMEDVIAEVAADRQGNAMAHPLGVGRFV